MHLYLQIPPPYIALSLLYILHRFTPKSFRQMPNPMLCKSRPKPKTYGTSKYNDLINLMFDDGKTHNFIEIRDTMSKLAEHKFSDGNISTLLKYAIKHNMIKKESRGQYRKQE
jgi:hypothetical protein